MSNALVEFSGSGIWKTLCRIGLVSLSDGEKKRVQIARAVMTDPEMLLS